MSYYNVQIRVYEVSGKGFEKVLLRKSTAPAVRNLHINGYIQE